MNRDHCDKSRHAFDKPGRTPLTRMADGGIAVPMRRLTNVLGAALLLGAGSSLCSAAQTNSAAPAVASYTQEEVKRYADALAALQRLNQQVATKEPTLAPEQRVALQQEANEQRRGILQHFALDPATFNAMSKAVEADPALAERVRQTLMASMVGP